MTTIPKITNEISDTLFLKAPLWFFAIYYLIYQYVDESFRAPLFIATMLVLGEPHFGMTWHIIYFKENWEWMKQDKFVFIFMPVYLVITFFVVAGFFGLEKALFLFLCFNFFHVTRQSAGVCKIFSGGNVKNYRVFSFFIWIFSVVCFVVGLTRFGFLPAIIGDPNLLPIREFALISIVLIFLVLRIFYRQHPGMWWGALTGAFMFFPMLVTDEIIHAFAMGVGMHYLQYLYITCVIATRRSPIRDAANTSLGKTAIVNPRSWNISKASLLLVTYILAYSITMTLFSNIGKIYAGDTLKYLFLIPVIFQLLHFYYDMYIWRFSNPNVRKVKSPYLFAKSL